MQVHQVVLLSRLGSSLWGIQAPVPADPLHPQHTPSSPQSHPPSTVQSTGRWACPPGPSLLQPPDPKPRRQCRKGCRCRGARARYGPGSRSGPELTCGRNAPTFPTWAGAGEASSPAQAAIRQVGHAASPSGPRSPSTRRIPRTERPRGWPVADHGLPALRSLFSPPPGPHLRFQLSLKRQSPISPALTLGPSAPATRAL